MSWNFKTSGTKREVEARMEALTDKDVPFGVREFLLCAIKLTDSENISVESHGHLHTSPQKEGDCNCFVKVQGMK
jgi:hypothetical protein